MYAKIYNINVITLKQSNNLNNKDVYMNSYLKVRGLNNALYTQTHSQPHPPNSHIEILCNNYKPYIRF